MIMPISTPPDLIALYGGDSEHFPNVREKLFEPAIRRAGLEPVSPVATGDDVIHSRIIQQLATADVVLCDLSAFNPNVFFELGVRTALDKPACLVRDEFVVDLPFDVSGLNCHPYKSVPTWNLEEEIEKLSRQIQAVVGGDGRNAMWKVFGVEAQGDFSPSGYSEADTLSVLLDEVRNLRLTLGKQGSASLGSVKDGDLFIADAMSSSPPGWIVGARQRGNVVHLDLSNNLLMLMPYLYRLAADRELGLEFHFPGQEGALSAQVTRGTSNEAQADDSATRHINVVRGAREEGQP